jgi:MATE family multidrug resistance protein
LIDNVTTGVAVGSGWQSYVAYINLGCYYIIGVPLGFIMGWVFNQGVMVCLICLPFLLS